MTLPDQSDSARAAAGEPVACITWGNGRRDGVSFEVPLRYVDLALVVTMLQDESALLPPAALDRAQGIANDLRRLGVEPLL